LYLEYIITYADVTKGLATAHPGKKSGWAMPTLETLTGLKTFKQ